MQRAAFGYSTLVKCVLMEGENPKPVADAADRAGPVEGCVEDTKAAAEWAQRQPAPLRRFAFKIALL